MNWDRLEKVVSRASNQSSKEWIPSISDVDANILVTEFNLLFPEERLYRQIDDLQPEGWYHVTEDCQDFGIVTNRLGRYIIYSTIGENNFTEFIKSKNLVYTVFN